MWQTTLNVKEDKMKKCINCNARLTVSKGGDGLECKATLEGLLSKDALWSKLQVKGAPEKCEWYSDSEEKEV
jgi:hypothetical protein